jgi:hypothetical protein
MATEPKSLQTKAKTENRSRETAQEEDPLQIEPDQIKHPIKTVNPKKRDRTKIDRRNDRAAAKTEINEETPPRSARRCVPLSMRT